MKQAPGLWNSLFQLLDRISRIAVRLGCFLHGEPGFWQKPQLRENAPLSGNDVLRVLKTPNIHQGHK